MGQTNEGAGVLVELRSEGQEEDLRAVSQTAASGPGPPDTLTLSESHGTWQGPLPLGLHSGTMLVLCRGQGFYLRQEEIIY